MMRFPFALLVAVVGCHEPTGRGTVIVATPPPLTSSERVVQQPAESVPADAAPGEPGKEHGLLVLASAVQVKLGASPLQASAPKRIGKRPKKIRKLREISRVADNAPLERFESQSRPYDSHRLNEIREVPATLPDGARPDIPTSYLEQPLRVITESGGKLLLVYGPRYLAVVGETDVEQVIDFDPPELPLSKEDRLFSDVHDAVYDEGIVYVCRGYNGWLRSRKGYVTAVEVATGEMRWRSKAQTCGGVVGIIGDYVITGYGEDVMPYAFKLLLRADGTIVQSIRNDGAAFDFLVDGGAVVVETYRHRITYELR